MTWKKVNNADAGTADLFGGNDLDKLFDSMNGVDVSDPHIFSVDINTLRANTNTAGDILKSNGTKYVRLPRGTALQQIRTNAAGTDIEWFTPTREDLCAFFSMARKTDIPSTYTDLEWLSLSSTGTAHVAGTTVYETSIDFTGKTQVKAQWIHGRNGTGTQDVRIVDTGGTNVLFTSTGHTTDGRKTVALTTLPAWAIGVSTIKIQMKSTVTTDDPSITDMAIYLK